LDPNITFASVLCLHSHLHPPRTHFWITNSHGQRQQVHSNGACRLTAESIQLVLVFHPEPSTHMSVNELSFILAKNNGNAPSAPNIPSYINTHCVARHTPEPTRSPECPSQAFQPPVAVFDLPQRPGPVHCYPPTYTRGVGHTSRDGSRPTVEVRLISQPARPHTILCALRFHSATLLIIFRYQGTQLLQEIANAALYPVGTSGTSSVSPRTALNNKPADNGSPSLMPRFHYDDADEYRAGSLPSPATAASSSSRNEATQMVKYGMTIRCQCMSIELALSQQCSLSWS